MEPIPFIINIDELEKVLNSSLSIYTAETKMEGSVFMTANCEIIHEDLDWIVQYSEKWQTLPCL